MPTEDPRFPGRQRRDRQDESVVFYWCALSKAVKLGFLPKTERLDYPPGSDEMSARCFVLQSQMHRWLADPIRADRYDGKRIRTIRELIRLYTSDPDSPYRRLDPETRKVYNWLLRQIDQRVGKRVISTLTGKDFYRWYTNWRQPKVPGGRETIATAHNLITMVRTLFGFGIQWRVPDAMVVREILAKMTFQNAQPRGEYLTYDMAVALIDEALELGELAMALAQALQFDLMLRQWDVIGKWTPREDDPTVLEWESGLRWEYILRPQLILKHVPGKTQDTTGQDVVFDLNDYELVTKVLSRFAVIPEIGPMIVNPNTGLPFTYSAYHRRWCKIAERTGVIPKSIWNRDSRAGGVTEGGDAGASIEDLAQHAGHARLETTRRYNRKTLVKTKRVAKLRKEHRNEK